MCLRAFFHLSLTKYSSSYDLCSLALKNRALGKWLPGKRVERDLRVLGKRVGKSRGPRKLRSSVPAPQKGHLSALPHVTRLASSKWNL